MITTFGFQIAFYSVCGVIASLALVSYFRRKRREKLLSQRPHEEISRLDRLQLELQNGKSTSRVASEASVSPSSTVEPPIAILKPHLAPATQPPADVAATGATGAASMSNDALPNVSDAWAEETPGYRSFNSAGTTWQDRTLFSSTGPSGWRVSPAIPRVDPQDVPTVDTSDYVYGAATPVLAAFLPEGDNSKRTLARELRQAGDYAPHARENLAATRFLFMFGSLMFGGICVLMAPPTLERPLLIGMLALTGLGWAMPALLVRSRAKSRRTEVERAIPDMMDMLNMCVSQGLTVPDSLSRVAVDLKPVYPALSQELSIVVDQTKVGTLNEALTNFAERIDIPQVDSFVSLITQTERMGTSVSDALTEYSDNMRESLRQRADERANQSSFSLLFPTVFCLMPAVFMFLMGPAVIELTKFTNAGGLQALNQGRDALRNLNNQEVRAGQTAAGGGNAGQ